MSMKVKIEIKNLITGKVLFKLEREDNSVKKTLEEAVKNNAYLGGADLRGADLGGAYLGGADLGDAYLGCADLGDAYLVNAYLGGADLGVAYLGVAYLRGAYLGGADLRCADLGGADLGDAYLRGADLGDAYLRGADLGGADLGCAYLRGADLRGADLRGAKNIPFIHISCPSDGAFIGWKKVKGCLIKLQIPEDAQRCSDTGTKCRCDKALVLEITDLKRNQPVEQIENNSYHPFLTYKVGEMVYPDSFDETRWIECSHGIHFFINKQEAIEY